MTHLKGLSVDVSELRYGQDGLVSVYDHLQDSSNLPLKDNILNRFSGDHTPNEIA